MWQYSCRNSNKAKRSLKEVEDAIVEDIKKSRTPITHMGSAQAGTSNGWHYANGPHHNAASSSSVTLFGTNLSYPERYPPTEATINPNKRKRDSTDLNIPPTFVGMPIIPVDSPQTLSRLTSPLGLSATRSGTQNRNRNSGLMFRSSQGEPSTIVTTSRGPVARVPTPAVARPLAPGMVDRGKQPVQASGSGSGPARREPNPRFPSYLLNRNNNTGR